MFTSVGVANRIPVCNGGDSSGLWKTRHTLVVPGGEEENETGEQEEAEAEDEGLSLSTTFIDSSGVRADSKFVQSETSIHFRFSNSISVRELSRKSNSIV